MNWGYKIFIVFAVFVSGIVFLVYKSSEKKVDLVTTDYYDKELMYQHTIDARNNAGNLSDTVKYAVVNDQLTINFPKDFAGKKIDGEATLYFPSDETKDVVHKFSIQDASVMVAVNAGNKKEFNLQLSWQAGGESYYFEKRLIIK